MYAFACMLDIRRIDVRLSGIAYALHVSDGECVGYRSSLNEISNWPNYTNQKHSYRQYISISIHLCVYIPYVNEYTGPVTVVNALASALRLAYIHMGLI